MALPDAAPGTVDALACELARIVMAHDPARASDLGLHERDHELPAPTPQALAAYARDVRGLRGRIVAHATRGVEEDVDRRGLLAIVDNLLATFDLLRPWQRDPVTWALSATRSLLVPLVRTHLPEEHRRAAVAGRCAAIPAYLDAARALLEPAEVPARWVPLAGGSARAGAAFLRDAVAGAHPEAAGVAGEAARALEAFAAWLDDFAGRATGTYVLGEQGLARLLARVHLLDAAPADVAARGRDLLDRYDAALTEFADGSDWRAALADARRSHPPPAELVPAYRRELALLKAFCLDNDLVTDPRAEATLEATPRFLRPVLGYAAYFPPGPFDELLSGVLWVTPPADEAALGDHSYGAIAAITAHEGYPGHHLQLTTVSRLASVTRKLRGGTSLMVEGWGLYVEELMHESGYYDRNARLVQLAMSAWRAARIVADIGLHTGEMGVDEAIALLADRAGISRGTATTEVNRYTMTPTQPFSYLYGAEEIRRIRAAWRQRTGGGLRAFHDALLSYGHLPPALVAEALVPDGTDPGPG